MNTQTINITLDNAQDYQENWSRMSQAEQAEAIQLGIARQRYWFNISLYGEGSSYQGQGNIKMRVKHVTQLDGYDQDAIWSSPETSIIPNAEEVHAIMCYILGQPLPVGYESGLPRIQGLIEAMGGITLLNPQLEPTPEPEPETP